MSSPMASIGNRAKKRFAMYARTADFGFANLGKHTKNTEYTFKEIEETIYDNSLHAKCRYSSDLLMVEDVISIDRSHDPDSLLRCLTDWRVRLADRATLAIIVCTLFVSPLTFIFNGRWSKPEFVPGGRSLMVFDFLLDLFYLAYLLLQLFVSLLDPKRRVEIVNLREVRRRRLTFIYYFEILTTTMYIWIMSVDAPPLLNCVKLSRGRLFSKLPDSLWRYNGTRKYRLFKPVFFILFGSHWLACILGCAGGYAKSLHDYGDSRFETTILGSPVSGRISMYFMAFVEALYLLTGSFDNPLGDGGAREGHFGNLILVSVFGPIGCVVIAQFIAAVVHEQQLMYSLEIRQQENIAFIKRAMENLDIPDALRTRVFSLLYYQKMGHDPEAVNKLFDKKNLSSSLDSALRVVLYKDSVLCSRYFISKDPNYILEVVRALKDEMYLPGDFIIRRGEVGTQMFFVAHGKMSVLSAKRDVINTIRNKGDFFGEIALVKDCVRTASVRADVYVLVSTLARQNITLIWKYYPEEQEQLQRMITQAAQRSKAGASASTQEVDGGSSMLEYKEDVEVVFNPGPAGANGSQQLSQQDYSAKVVQEEACDAKDDAPVDEKEHNAIEKPATEAPSTQSTPETQFKEPATDPVLNACGNVGSLDCDHLRESLRFLGEQVDELLRRQNAVQSKLMLEHHFPDTSLESAHSKKKNKKIVKKTPSKLPLDDSSLSGHRRVLNSKRPKPIQIPKRAVDSAQMVTSAEESNTSVIGQSSLEALPSVEESNE